MTINIDRPLRRQVVDYITETTSTLPNYSSNKFSERYPVLNEQRMFRKYSAELLKKLWVAEGKPAISSDYKTFSVYYPDNPSQPVLQINAPNYYADKNKIDDQFTLPVRINESTLGAISVDKYKEIVNKYLDQFLEKIEADIKNNPFGGRKRKTRKHRSRKSKKTRKH